MKILHLEDSADDSELICAALGQDTVDCEVTRVETRKTFVEALARGDWDVILADYSLPSFDGISALKIAAAKSPNVPFIFVTGALGEELAVETLKNGAIDFILKNRLNRLAQAVARALRETESAQARERAERKLRASLREKELLLQEIHHRVKNNLQIVCSLLNMQSTAANSPAVSDALQTSQQRVQSMAKIHEMLYGADDLNEIDFAEYSRRLATELALSYGNDPARIRLTFALEPIRLEIDRAIPCGLILNELVSNSLKYAFADGRDGQIQISLRQTESQIQLAVEDNGVGLPEASTGGRANSLGLRIVNILAQQLGGRMEITSNHGARFALAFNLNGD